MDIRWLLFCTVTFSSGLAARVSASNLEGVVKGWIGECLSFVDMVELHSQTILLRLDEDRKHRLADY